MNSAPLDEVVQMLAPTKPETCQHGGGPFMVTHTVCPRVVFLSCSRECTRDYMIRTKDDDPGCRLVDYRGD